MPLDFGVVEGWEVQTSHGMKHMDGVVLFDAGIEGHCETLFGVAQYASCESAKKSA